MDIDLRDRFIRLWADSFDGAALPICLYYSDDEANRRHLWPMKGHACLIPRLRWARKGGTLSVDADSIGCGGGWDKATIDAAAARYAAVGRQLARCLAKTRRAAGREHLALLTNRAGCTVLHLKSMAVAAELQPICKGKKPAELGDADRARVREICDRSLKLMDDYKVLHARAIADRGCEGTLINYLTVTPVVVRRIRRDYGDGGKSKN